MDHPDLSISNIQFMIVTSLSDEMNIVGKLIESYFRRYAFQFYTSKNDVNMNMNSNNNKKLVLSTPLWRCSRSKIGKLKHIKCLQKPFDHLGLLLSTIGPLKQQYV